MKKVSFRKLFRVLTERDEGRVIDAICFYQSIPWMYQSVTLSEEEAKEKGYMVENIVTQYKRRFYLDLWLVVIQFQWFSKDTYNNLSLEQ